MEFVVAIERGDADHAYGVVVPALPGCFSAGDSFEEALANAREAIELHVEALMDSADGLPPVGSVDAQVESTQANPELAGWLIAVVRLDPEVLDDAVERVNISIPRRVLHAIDKAASQAGRNRSAFLADAGLAMATRQLSDPHSDW